MKYYNINTEFGFGKYTGQVLKHIAEHDTEYINWCIENLDHFVFTETVENELLAACPSFNISTGSRDILKEKRKTKSWALMLEEKVEAQIAAAIPDPEEIIKFQIGNSIPDPKELIRAQLEAQVEAAIRNSEAFIEAQIEPEIPDSEVDVEIGMRKEF